MTLARGPIVRSPVIVRPTRLLSRGKNTVTPVCPYYAVDMSENPLLATLAKVTHTGYRPVGESYMMLTTGARSSSDGRTDRV